VRRMLAEQTECYFDNIPNLICNSGFLKPIWRFPSIQVFSGICKSAPYWTVLETCMCHFTCVSQPINPRNPKHQSKTGQAKDDQAR